MSFITKAQSITDNYPLLPFIPRSSGLMLSSLLVATSIQAAPVFVNEIHYDNKFTDAGEAIEIAGPSGTNLAGWDLVLYNGANGQEYTTTPLGGVIPDQQNGIGTLSFSYPTNGIQNGAPDGIALVDAANNVVQFLSYEGMFMAVDGPAVGMNSTNIGTTESTSTQFGFSMQLTGTGRESGDFSWSSSLPDTFGSLNNPTGGPTDLFFSEYVEGSSSNKALEIFNGTGGAIDLTGGYQFEIYSNGSPNPVTTIALDGLLGDGDVWVVTDPNASFSGLADQVATTSLFNGDDAVGLRNLYTNTLIDVIGQIGFDPGSEWFGGGIGTRDETLRRSSAIYAGDPDGSNSFDPSAEWLGFPQNTFDGLGSHAFVPPSQVLAQQIISPLAGSIPAPATIALFGLGLAGLGWSRRKQTS